MKPTTARRPRLGLRGIFIMVLGATFAASLLVIAAAWEQHRAGHSEVAALSRAAMRDLALAGVQERGESITRLLASSLTNPLYYFDLDVIGEVLRSALAQPDIAYVFVYDDEGRVIHDGSSDIAEFGQVMVDAMAAEAIAAVGLHVQQSAQLVDVAIPMWIGRERIGGIRVGLSLTGPEHLETAASIALQGRIDSAVARSLELLAGLLGGLLLIGGLFSLMISRGLVMPIRRLADAARQIEAGKYTLALPSTRGDEIGELQRAFTHMGEAVAAHDRHIRRVAYSDSLTGLPNRLALREALDQRLQAAQHGSPQIALIFVDLDDFKRVNDTLGHDAGDAVLEQFAQRMQQCIGLIEDPEACVARLGGDEFVALFSAHDAHAAACMFGEAVLLESQRPMRVRGEQVFMGASIGIAVFPDDAADAHQLFKRGDIAMYQAKLAGKNCLRFFSASEPAVEAGESS